MIISEIEVTRLLALDSAVRPGSAGRHDVVTATTSPVDMPMNSHEIQRIRQIVDGLPDAREERVQALKAQIEAGTYSVSSRDIADLIIRRSLADRTAL